MHTVPTTKPMSKRKSRTIRLHHALDGYGLFLAAARDADPLPRLRDLACDWMYAEEVVIHIPAGLAPLHCNDSNKICGSIPIGRQVVGAIEVYRSHPFDEDDRALLATLGKMIGAALEHHSLQSQIVSHALEARAYSDTLDRLLDFGRQVVRGAATPLELASLIVSQIPVMVSGERASLLLLPDEMGDEPVLVLSDRTVTTTERAVQVSEQGLVAMVLRDRLPIIIDETDTDHRWLSLPMHQTNTPTRCAMAVPLLWGSYVVGVLTVTTSQSRLFSPTHLNLLELVACHVSLAVHAALIDARVAANAATMGAMATYLETALQAIQAGDVTALATVVAVAERLRHEQQSLLAKAS